MPPGLEITEDALTISSLNSEHVGAYQCVARLGHGSAIASCPAHIAIAGTDAENDPLVCTGAAMLRARGKGSPRS